MQSAFQHTEITDGESRVSEQVHRLRVSLAETREDVAVLISVWQGRPYDFYVLLMAKHILF